MCWIDIYMGQKLLYKDPSHFQNLVALLLTVLSMKTNDQIRENKTFAITIYRGKLYIVH